MKERKEETSPSLMETSKIVINIQCLFYENFFVECLPIFWMSLVH